MKETALIEPTAERVRNLAAYDRLKEEIARHPGQFVVISHGKVTYVPTFGEARKLGDRPGSLVFQAGSEPKRTPVYLRELGAFLPAILNVVMDDDFGIRSSTAP